MTRLQRIVRNYFGFSQTETNGFLILLPLMTVFIFSEPVYRWWYIRYARHEMEDHATLDSIVARWELEKPVGEKKITDSNLFLFDPNSASQHQLMALGLNEKLAARIIRYREKGGKFRVKNDLRKIYGMDSALCLRLDPWIRLPTTAEHSATVAKGGRKPLARVKKELFDLNLADTTTLIGIYGIGPRLAMRTVGYRQRLGGFVSMEQLREVYGLDSAAIGQLKKWSFIAPDFQPRQIDLNRAEKKDLTALPYIKFTLANAITAWRFQHGNFKSVDELRQIVLLDEPTFQKIKPYLTVKE